jgi:hypothetical protein
MRKLRLVTEAEAIGEFLKNEFYEMEYNRDRDQYEPYVLKPNFADPAENAIRRALLFRRRGHMWRELPADTQWWQVEIEARDLPRVHVFPRAHWRKISDGSYSIGDVVQRIRERRYKDGGNQVIAKIQQLRYRLQSDSYIPSTVLLIGLDEQKPVTILEGNHRFAAAMLVSPDIARIRFRVVCGFSPKMGECCWYRTNFSNLWRYMQHRLANLYTSEPDLRQLRVMPGQSPNELSEVLAGKKLSGPQT